MKSEAILLPRASPPPPHLSPPLPFFCLHLILLLPVYASVLLAAFWNAEASEQSKHFHVHREPSQAGTRGSRQPRCVGRVPNPAPPVPLMQALPPSGPLLPQLEVKSQELPCYRLPSPLPLCLPSMFLPSPPTPSLREEAGEAPASQVPIPSGRVPGASGRRSLTLRTNPSGQARSYLYTL